MVMKYYSLKRLDDTGATYRMAFGKRSDGKTYAGLEKGLISYFNDGSQIAYIRRWDTDFVGANSAKTVFDTLTYNGEGKNRIRELSGGLYDGIDYYSGKYYLTIYDEEKEKTVRTDKIVGYGFSINTAEHYKSASFPGIKTIIFDEFIATNNYLYDEFIQFQNLLSTIIRQRGDVVIYMFGNTISKYNPYFKEMGLTNAKTMLPGTIDIYQYGDTELTVAVEFCDVGAGQKRKSDKYFAFDNQEIKMITSNEWQIELYPHCPERYSKKNVIFEYFIEFDDELFHAEIVQKTNRMFTFIHEKTTPIKDPERDLIFSPKYDARKNHRRNIIKPILPIEKKILRFYKEDKVFFQNNSVGNTIHAYLEWCNSN